MTEQMQAEIAELNHRLEEIDDPRRSYAIVQEKIRAYRKHGQQVPEALKLNPSFFNAVYHDLLNEKKTRKSVEAALAAVDGYVAERAQKLFAPIIEHLTEVGEPRSATEIEHYFERNYNVSGVTTVCEYLADQGIIGKSAVSVRLTKRSTVDVEELAFFAMSEPPDQF